MGDGVLIAGILDPSTLLAFFKGACGLGIVIFVHELGHFLVAKACGVKCEKIGCSLRNRGDRVVKCR